MLKSLAVIALVLVPAIVHADAGPSIDPNIAASASRPLVSERFPVVVDAAVGRLGSRYVRIDKRRGGFGLINSLWIRPDQPRLAVLPSYPDYISVGLDLAHPVRHDYKPLFGATVVFPWSRVTIASADGRYLVYTGNDEAAVLTWR